MPDVFLEQRVVRRLSRRDYLVRGAVALGSLLLAGVVLVLAGNALLGLLLAAALVWVNIAVAKRQRQEFEYALTNGALDIDVIYNKEWRRRLYSLELGKHVVLMGRLDDPAHGPLLERLRPWHQLGAGTPSTDTHFLVVRRDDRAEHLLIWDPSPEMVRACRQAAPRLVCPQRT